jgi:heat shock protein HtpX
MKNTLKTTALLAILTALFMGIGRMLGGPNGMIVGLMFAGVMNLGAYWFSDKLVLRMHGAKRLSPESAPELYAMVERLALKRGLPMPALYLVADSAPNAFATGRNPKHAAVAVTAGLLELLNEEELEGVLGHELGHVQNRDTLISTVAATFAGALSMLADMAIWSTLLGRNDDREDGNAGAGLLGIIMAPIAAALIQSAISRTREFLADETGAESTGNPLALASALEKIEGWKGQLQGTTPATAHLYIINPLSGRDMLRLFSTHPPTAERVKRLHAFRNKPRRVA